MAVIIRKIIEPMAEIFEILTERISKGYQDAKGYIEQFPDKRLRITPLANRQKEAGDIALAQIFSTLSRQGFSCDASSTRNRSYFYPLGATSGAIFSIHRLSHQAAKLRPANFRHNHAFNNQYSLIPYIQHDSSKDPYIYILHGPSEKHGTELGFIKLALPSYERNVFIEEMSLPLIRKMSIANAPLPPEKELEVAVPTPKRQKKDME